MSLQGCLEVSFAAAVGGNVDYGAQVKFGVVVKHEDELGNVQLLAHQQAHIVPIINGKKRVD